MQLNHASDATNAFPRQTTSRLFCVTLTYVTLRGRTGARVWPRYLPSSVVVSTQSITSSYSYGTLAAKFLSSNATTVLYCTVLNGCFRLLNKKRASFISSNPNKLLCLHSWLN